MRKSLAVLIDPIFNVGLLRSNRVFAYSNAATFINYAATSGMTFLMSLYLEFNRGLNPSTAGLVIVTGTVVQTLFSPVAGRLADRVQARFLASIGMAVCVLALGAFVFLGRATAYWYIITTLCVTDIEHPSQLGIDRGFVVESLVLPGKRMARRRLQAAFSHAVLPSPQASTARRERGFLRD